jgi:putative ATP-binding cassette transporter
MLMRILSEELHSTTIVSVGHRQELEAFHERKLVLERRAGGARLVRDHVIKPRGWLPWQWPRGSRSRLAKGQAAE